MLVLTRRANQSIMIGHEIVVTVLEVRGDQVRLGIKAPRSIDVHREEIFAQLQQANRDAVQPKPNELEALPGLPHTADERVRLALAADASVAERSARAEVGERVDVAVDVGFGVLHRERPLLLVAGRHEQAAVDHPRVRRRVEVGVRLEEVAVVAERLGPVRHAALGAEIHRVRGDVVGVERGRAALARAGSRARRGARTRRA